MLNKSLERNASAMSSGKFTMDKGNKNTTETREEKLFCQHYYHDFLIQ